MRYFVFTTLTNDHQYTNWTRPPEKTMRPEIIPNPVLIKGGANRATSPESKTGRHTPKGVMTEVTEAQLEYLEQNTVFKKHKAQGLIVVTQSKEDPEDIARSMAPKDNSAPITPDHPLFHKTGTADEDPIKPMKGGIINTAVSKVKDALS